MKEEREKEEELEKERKIKEEKEKNEKKRSNLKEGLLKLDNFIKKKNKKTFIELLKLKKLLLLNIKNGLELIEQIFKDSNYLKKKAFYYKLKSFL